ncbi:MAG TPA: fused MFS/spermidine synthase [Gemmatimonadaceae bacterium]|nr:fused MFS/spermidine synthase [Gemmatimonadaceae bacterium]
MVALFSLAALTSAFLLFWVEPLFAKLVLPLLGGSPAVWNTCLMFFQAMLLLGYLYAHVSSRYLDPRRQALTHVGLLALALLSLPVAIPGGWTPPASGNVIPWLLLLLTIAVGAPFMVLAATAPLLQRWMSSLDHPAAENPYTLYAASNAGSLVGLLAFPFVMEPNLRLGQQSRLWSVSYVAALVLVGACAWVVWKRSRSVAPAPLAAGETSEPARAPTWLDRARWIALSFVPSSLLLGVTTYLSTDVAAVPLLWVVPLALYLTTFIIVFARRSREPMRLAAVIHSLLVITLILLVFWDEDLDLAEQYLLHLAVFAATALILHSELAARRPAPAHLTEFYLWMSLGGALGGAFNALAAPLLFDSIREYMLVVVLACFLRPSWRTRIEEFLSPAGAPSTFTALIPALLLAIFWRDVENRELLGVSAKVILSVVAAALTLLLSSNTLRFGVSIAAIAIIGETMVQRPLRALFTDRSFFGAYRVERTSGPANFLTHGTTIHGAQFLDSTRRRKPVTYYHPNGPVGQLFAGFWGGLPNNQVGAVGLGAGSVICYSKPGEEWTFFEIDPLVERISRNPKYFTFLKDCGKVQPKVVIGDARLTLARQPEKRFGLLIVDAFSSDAIPIHLLTREAFRVYERVLHERGLLFVHISNQRLDLEPVVAALAADAGMVALLNDYAPHKDGDRDLDYSADWVVLARRIEDLGPLAKDERWRPLKRGGFTRPWTDDYSDILSIVQW